VSERNEVERLFDELFHKVERAQGYAFVSDGETFETKAELFKRIRGRLEWNKAASRIMAAWLRKHKAQRGDT
jgi:hypothetical protein